MIRKKKVGARKKIKHLVDYKGTTNFLYSRWKVLKTKESQLALRNNDTVLLRINYKLYKICQTRKIATTHFCIKGIRQNQFYFISSWLNLRGKFNLVLLLARSHVERRSLLPAIISSLLGLAIILYYNYYNFVQNYSQLSLQFIFIRFLLQNWFFSNIVQWRSFWNCDEHSVLDIEKFLKQSLFLELIDINFSSIEEV